MIHNPGIPPQRAPLGRAVRERAAPERAVLDPDLPTPDQLEAITATLRAIPMAAVAHTLTYRLLAANDDCVSMLHLHGEINGRPVGDFIPASDMRSALDSARSILHASSEGNPHRGTTYHSGVASHGGADPDHGSHTPGDHPERPASSLRRLISGDGRALTCWMHVGIATIAGFRCFVACIDLVNPVLSQAHRWRHRAEHDELTGLRRRGSMLDQVAQWIDTNRTVMLAFLDIDNFKSINDTHGHAAGDHVLITLARRLEQHAPPGCVVGRLSGDEFVLSHAVGSLVDGYGRHADPMDDLRESDRVRLLAVGPRCVAEPIAWGDHLLMISISVGVTISEAGEDPATLLARADEAMYAQKARSDRPLR